MVSVVTIKDGKPFRGACTTRPKARERVQKHEKGCKFKARADIMASLDSSVDATVHTYYRRQHCKHTVDTIEKDISCLPVVF